MEIAVSMFSVANRCTFSAVRKPKCVRDVTDLSLLTSRSIDAKGTPTMPILKIDLTAPIHHALCDAARKRGTTEASLAVEAVKDYLATGLHRIYQISTSGALVEGVFTGAILSNQILEHGDFGLGTFESLDGEMVIVDGAIYQLNSDGAALRRQDRFPVPFAVVTCFIPRETFFSGKIDCLKDLELVCDRHRQSDNLFYAFRIDAYFTSVHARAVSSVKPGVRLIDAAEVQSEFTYRDLDGTLVCFWSPIYASSFNIPGYHFHFISKDRTKGGHVLNCTAKALEVGVQTLSEYDVQLPDVGAFLGADLNKDTTGDLAKAE
jgi:acetolactate decarboxylase